MAQSTYLSEEFSHKRKQLNDHRFSQIENTNMPNKIKYLSATTLTASEYKGKGTWFAFWGHILEVTHPC